MTLLMRDQENLEKGMEKGIYGMVTTLKELNISEDVILRKLEEKFQLTEKESKEYLQKAK